jgi:hypothetical protein
MDTAQDSYGCSRHWDGMLANKLGIGSWRWQCGSGGGGQQTAIRSRVSVDNILRHEKDKINIKKINIQLVFRFSGGWRSSSSHNR